MSFTLTLLSSNISGERKCVYIHYSANLSFADGRNCSQKHICNTTFKVQYISLLPFYHKSIRNLFENILKSCCGECFNLTQFKENADHFTNISQVTPLSLQQADFVYPILAYSSLYQTVYGHYFIPLFDLQGGFYITAKKNI